MRSLTIARWIIPQQSRHSLHIRSLFLFPFNHLQIPLSRNSFRLFIMQKARSRVIPRTLVAHHSHVTPLITMSNRALVDGSQLRRTVPPGAHPTLTSLLARRTFLPEPLNLLIRHHRRGHDLPPPN